MTKVDMEHGNVIETRTTETAIIFIHEDGYKEIIWKTEIQEQPITVIA